MAVKEILLLGNARLYEASKPVREADVQRLDVVIQNLQDTMMAFRGRYGRGRAIASPQLGVMLRLVYMHIDRPVVFINPLLDIKSRQMVELWDDCMSSLDLFVKVRSCRYERNTEPTGRRRIGDT
ncbi:MAG: peptide deformylase [Candidatus Krumholzibacteria bacterium]|nr:peptide deformylase [Candidatus Krumholzibacteria bacterium]